MRYREIVKRLVVAVLPVLFLQGVGRCAFGLRFTSYTAKDGNRVLIVRDCGKRLEAIPAAGEEDRQHPCSEPESSFTAQNTDPRAPIWEGDAEILERMLTAQERAGHPYVEIWLHSGGGDVDAGIGIARALRDHRMTVHLPGGFECVSSCTIAFMGGLFRYMDEGALYKVHSASIFQGATPKTNRWIARINADPDAGLADFARYEQPDARLLGLRLFYVFESTLMLTKPGVHPVPSDSSMEAWANQAGLPDPPYSAPGNPQRKADVLRIRSEGLAAIQDITMRIERESMQAALLDIEQATPTVPRAKPALRMVSTMYTTSIRETSPLNRSTMLQLGYLTDDALSGK